MQTGETDENIKEQKSHCPQCGAEFSEDSVKCPQCGKCSGCCECGEH